MKVKKEMVSIKRSVALVWLFFIICCSALSSSSSSAESTLVSKAGDYKNLAKHKQPIKNGYGSKVMKLNEVEKKSKALKGLHEVLNLETDVSKGKESIGINTQSKKAYKGVRPKRKKGGAPSLSLRSYSSMAIKALALGLLFYAFF